jgi:hypothetical protein
MKALGRAGSTRGILTELATSACQHCRDRRDGDAERVRNELVRMARLDQVKHTLFARAERVCGRFRLQRRRSIQERAELAAAHDSEFPVGGGELFFDGPRGRAPQEGELLVREAARSELHEVALG